MTINSVISASERDTFKRIVKISRDPRREKCLRETLRIRLVMKLPRSWRSGAVITQSLTPLVGNNGIMLNSDKFSFCGQGAAPSRACQGHQRVPHTNQPD